MSTTIVVSDVAGLRSITLNRPDRLNSFTAEMGDLFNEILIDSASSDDVRALLLTGAGRGFCAGQDLNDRAVAPGEAVPDLGESLEKRYNPAVRAMRSMPKPVIVAVNGVAAGAGANLALAGDVVFAGHSAKFIQSFSRLGLVPDSGGTHFLPSKVGTARALGLALLGEPLSAEQAEDWGLIWRAVPDEDLLTIATTAATQLAAGPTAGFAKIKVAINASASNSLDAQLDLERDLQRAAGASHDYSEGVAAFLEKRPAVFEGR